MFGKTMLEETMGKIDQKWPKNPTPISSKMALSAKTAVKIEILDPNYVHFHRSNPDLLENDFEKAEILKKSAPKT